MARGLAAWVGDGLPFSPRCFLFPLVRSTAVAAKGGRSRPAEEPRPSGAEDAVDEVGKFSFCGLAEFGSADSFFGGLDRLIGGPDPNLYAALRREHDSQATFRTPNTQLETSPATEFNFVACPEAHGPAPGGFKADGTRLCARAPIRVEDLLAGACDRMRAMGLDVTQKQVPAGGTPHTPTPRFACHSGYICRLFACTVPPPGG